METQQKTMESLLFDAQLFAALESKKVPSFKTSLSIVKVLKEVHEPEGNKGWLNSKALAERLNKSPDFICEVGGELVKQGFIKSDRAKGYKFKSL